MVRRLLGHEEVSRCRAMIESIQHIFVFSAKSKTNDDTVNEIKKALDCCS